MSSILIWLFLVWVLCLSTFGIWFCTFVTLSSIFLLFGFITMMYAGQDLNPHIPLRTVRCKNTYLCAHTGIPKVVQLVKNPPKQLKQDQRLTGSIKIDEPLQEIIHYIFRDYIYTWYKDVSSDDEFVVRLKELFKNVLNNISRSSIEVDWESFITKHVVDDFASHLRLYRQSEKAFRIAQKEQSGKYENLESAFFDLELSMEKNICRDTTCTFEEAEKRYLLQLSDILLYFLLPSEDFNNICFRYFLRDLLCNVVLYPTVSILADPDYINQNLIWACKDHLISSKAFLTVIRRTDSIDELLAVKEIAKHELKVHKAKDTCDKDEMKQYIKSITFVHDLADQRYQKLLNHNTEGESDSIDFSVDIDWSAFTGPEAEKKLIMLPFDIVLNNNVGLHYFTEFMTSINAQGYVFFYHNIEGFRATAETVLLDEGDVDGETNADQKMEKLREFAFQIFDTYLGENAAVGVKLDEVMLKKLYSRIKTERITESFFDDVQAKVYKIMQDEFYATTFKTSKYYVKLLAELDLLPDLSNKDEPLSPKLVDNDEFEKVNPQSSTSPDDEDIVITELFGGEVPNSEFFFPETPILDNFEGSKTDGVLTAEVYSTGITHHAGKTFAVYAIAVNFQRFEGPEERWFVVRRYSEFHEFHKAVTDKFPLLSSFDFPSKKAFNNLSRHLMEKRRHMLNEFLQFMLSLDVLAKCEGLQEMIYNFLEPRVCGKEKKSLVRTVGTLVNPIRTSVKTVGSVMKFVPNTLFGLKDGLVKVLNKASNPGSQEPYCFEMDKVSADLDFEAEDIPLRIVLLLLDEIFDLKSKDLWFRRRIMFLLRQIIKTTHGDAINRKVKEYIQEMMSATQLAEWLKIFSQAFWPSGKLAEPQQVRDDNTKLRTRIATKSLLICCIPDELKHVIGNETSFKGAITIFGLFQYPSLNRRLLYVLLESFLIALFPQNNIVQIIQRLHAESHRTAPLMPLSSSHFGNLKAGDSAEGNHSTEKVTISNASTKSKSHFFIKEDADFSLFQEQSSFSCIGRQDSIEPLPKHTRKSKKSSEKSVFYADFSSIDMLASDSVVAFHKVNR